MVPPQRTDRAAAGSHRRAMQCLAAKGLVELTWKTETVETKQKRRASLVVWDADAGIFLEVGPEHAPVARAIERRAVRLTALGELLVDRLRPELEHGRRIRWAAIEETDPK